MRVNMLIEVSETDLLYIGLTVIVCVILQVLFRGYCHFEGLRSFRRHSSQIAAQSAAFAEAAAGGGYFAPTPTPRATNS